MEKELEKRAIEATKKYDSKVDGAIHFRYGYINGATEQSEIDTETACAWLALNYEICVSKGFTTAMVIDAFRKAMED